VSTFLLVSFSRTVNPAHRRQTFFQIFQMEPICETQAYSLRRLTKAEEQKAESERESRDFGALTLFGFLHFVLCLPLLAFVTLQSPCVSTPLSLNAYRVKITAIARGASQRRKISAFPQGRQGHD